MDALNVAARAEVDRLAHELASSHAELARVRAELGRAQQQGQRDNRGERPDQVRTE